jgi:hypothetical protein
MSRSKIERIRNKMEAQPTVREEEDKKGCVEGREREEMGVYLRFGEKYTHGFSRARGTTKLNLFFLLIIGL